MQAVQISWQAVAVVGAVLVLAIIGGLFPDLAYIAPTIAVLLVFLRSALNGEQLKAMRVELNSRLSQLVASSVRAAELEGHLAADKEHKERADAEVVRADVATAEVLRVERADTAEVLRVERADAAEVLRVEREVPPAEKFSTDSLQ